MREASPRVDPKKSPRRWLREYREAAAERWKFEVYEDGQVVAAGEGPDRDRVLTEAAHYVRMYGQDGGDVKSLVWTGRKPKLK